MLDKVNGVSLCELVHRLECSAWRLFRWRLIHAPTGRRRKWFPSHR